MKVLHGCAVSIVHTARMLLKLSTDQLSDKNILSYKSVYKYIL